MRGRSRAFWEVGRCCAALTMTARRADPGQSSQGSRRHRRSALPRERLGGPEPRRYAHRLRSGPPAWPQPPWIRPLRPTALTRLCKASKEEWQWLVGKEVSRTKAVCQAWKARKRTWLYSQVVHLRRASSSGSDGRVGTAVSALASWTATSSSSLPGAKH